MVVTTAATSNSGNTAGDDSSEVAIAPPQPPPIEPEPSLATPMSSPAAPAPGETALGKKSRQDYLCVSPKVRLAQSRRYANIALEHYNKRKKVKFELSNANAMDICSVPELRCCYTHLNFTAKSSKQGSQEQLFFAELLYQRGRQIVIYCEPLGPNPIVGHKFLERDGTSPVTKNADFNYCFACSERMLHSKSEKFIGGHCSVRHIYEGLQ